MDPSGRGGEVIKFRYSPQQSDNSRTYYRFDTLNNIVYAYFVSGKTSIVHEGGSYRSQFTIGRTDEYILPLGPWPVNQEASPVQFITQSRMDDSGEWNITLLKQYGPEEVSRFEITYPDWNDAINEAFDYQLENLRTSLGDLEKMMLRWRVQLDEIICQNYNLSILLNSEYSKINAEQPPYGSPVSIRSLKTALIQNSILYIEALANMLVDMAVEMNRTNSNVEKRLRDTDIGKIKEKKKFLRLEEKVVILFGMISSMFGLAKKLEVGDHHWGIFRRLKGIRDSLSHIRLGDEFVGLELSFDRVAGIVDVTDNDLVESARMIYWFNSQVNELLKELPFDKTYVGGMNTYPVFLLFNLTAAINRKSIADIGSEYKFVHFGMFERL